MCTLIKKKYIQTRYRKKEKKKTFSIKHQLFLEN